MNLELIDTNGNPYYSQACDTIVKLQKEGNIRGMAVVYITKDDRIFTDYIRSNGTSVCELTGAVSILHTEMIEKMRGK